MKKKQLTLPEIKARFRSHRSDAKRRDIGFLFSFEEWLHIWRKSGHFSERGHCHGQYVMARFQDKGNYEVGNVKIVQCSVNNSEATKGKPKSKIMRSRLSKSRTGRKFGPFSVVARKNMSDAHVGLRHSTESIGYMRVIAESRARDGMGRFV